MPSPILAIIPLEFVWQTLDPFLFCVHHDDAYPAGNDRLGPNASLAGRNIGQDFAGIDGWRMYHGRDIPGFPQHPHRGFETVTIARRGFIDHSDSLGATARFGRGDVQWMTAGKGIVHAEMFPLLDPAGPNPVELFQIWLNLPAADKMVEPHFSMLWSEDIPVRTVQNANGRATEVTVIAGAYGDATPPPPPPHSWAARPEAKIAIWSLRMDPQAVFTLPAGPDTNRMLYVFAGGDVQIAGQMVHPRFGARLSGESVEIRCGDTPTELLFLQGRPIREPVVQHGPFVMNTQAGIQQAFMDYQRTRFGGWPWPKDGPVHARDAGRFALHASGKVERRST